MRRVLNAGERLLIRDRNHMAEWCCVRMIGALLSMRILQLNGVGCPIESRICPFPLGARCICECSLLNVW